ARPLVRSLSLPPAAAAPPPGRAPDNPRRPPPPPPPPPGAPPPPPPPPRARPRAAMVALPFLLLLAAIACFTWARWTPDGGHPLEAPLAALAGPLDLLAHARNAPTSVPG